MAPRLTERAGAAVRVVALVVVACGSTQPSPAPATAAVRARIPKTGQEVPGLRVAPLLVRRDAAGRASGVRSILVQFPARAMTGDDMDVKVPDTAAAYEAWP